MTQHTAPITRARRWRAFWPAVTALFLLVISTSGAAQAAARPDGWLDASHSNSAEPDYETVFPDDAVNEIAITIAPDQWALMQADMVDLLGEPGAAGRGGFPGLGGGQEGFGQGFGGAPAGFPPGVDGEFPELPADFADRMREGGGAFGPGGFGAGGSLVSRNPTWVEATVEFEGQEWTHVGVRYKGNSTLTSSWSSGSLKLPLKFDFDEFEDDYPEIKNQRFFGFKQLSLSNLVADDSYLRDTTAYDLLEAAGLVAAQTAFYHVTLEYGEGPVDLGIYVVVEPIDDTVIPGFFGGDDGNIYEGEGTAASFAAGTREEIPASFQKENNDDSDWSDLEELYDLLHSDTRKTAAEQWRAALEQVFDVDVFLRWLALSSALENWDAYGGMAHNYYLYDDPESGLITWISWDHDRILSAGGGGGFAEAGGGGPADPAVGRAGRFGGGFGGNFGSTSLDREETTDSWPLIRFLLDDPVYQALYLDHLADIEATVFDVDAILERSAWYQALLEPYFAGEDLVALKSAVAVFAERIETAGAALTAFVDGSEGP